VSKLLDAKMALLSKIRVIGVVEEDDAFLIIDIDPCRPNPLLRVSKEHATVVAEGPTKKCADGGSHGTQVVELDRDAPVVTLQSLRAEEAVRDCSCGVPGFASSKQEAGMSHGLVAHSSLMNSSPVDEALTSPLAGSQSLPFYCNAGCGKIISYCSGNTSGGKCTYCQSPGGHCRCPHCGKEYYYLGHTHN